MNRSIFSNVSTTEDYGYDDVSDLDEEDANKLDYTSSVIIISSYIISIPFLLVTFLVYTVLPELRNIHGLTLRGYVICQLVTNVSPVVMIIVSLAQRAIMSHFLFESIFLPPLTASYFWLNVMCIDIWWTFRGFHPLKRSKKQLERKKCIIYSTYVWGLTILLNGTWMTVDFVSANEEFGLESVKIWCVDGPISVTIFCNMILFVLTVKKMVRHNKETAHHLEGVDSMRHDNEKRWFGLYLKLFVVMGINWVLWMVSALDLRWKYTVFIKEVYTGLQGVIIFILFVCKKRILRSVMKRCCYRRPNSVQWTSTRRAHCSSDHRTSTTSPKPPHDPEYF